MKPLLIILLFTTTILSAQQLPQHVEFQELGLSFDIPEGWLGQLDGEHVLLGSHSQAGLMIAFENNSKTVSELKQIALQGFEIKGAYLDPVGDIVIKNAKRVEGMYQGMFNNNLVKCYAIGLINELGSGMTILMLAKSTEFTDAQKAAADELAGSVKFFQSNDSELTVQWKNRIMGRQLKYMYSLVDYDINGEGGSSSRDILIDLCHNGQFTYYSNSNISVDTGDEGIDTGDAEVYRGSTFSNSTNDSRGTFQIYSYDNEAVLELTFENGEVYEYDLSYESEDAILLNEIRYFILQSEECN
ncbi:hypothetical protein QQ008_30170 [Fulvivirgaceae bacterium BMA10]|uniref:Uncharacterized protein n=1 Tax=Splendidivirga corallicola TaxID=3051826 RepID=A0ABT8KY32_9BACT|nr:hypothetical protein [Fulvivirgaceae bacterium BMA10]